MKHAIYLITIFVWLTACKPTISKQQAEQVTASSEVADGNAITTKQKQIEQKQPKEVPYNYDGKWIYVNDKKEYYKEGTNNDNDKGLLIKSVDKNSNQYNVEMTLSDGAAETWFEDAFTINDKGQLVRKVKYYEGEGEYPNINVLIKYKDDNTIILKVNDFNETIINNEITFKRQSNNIKNKK